jgi:YbbR domain-containing protein
VAKLDTIYTTAFNLTGLNKTVDAKIELIRPNAMVYTGTNEVNLHIDVDRLLQQSLILPLSDVQAQTATRIQFFPSTVKVTYTSIQNASADADSTQFKVQIDSDKVQTSTQKCKVFVSAAPANVTVLSIEPSEVEILRFKGK